MAIKFTDVSFVLSGGIYNDNPNASLGGFPSPTPITNTLNNLFSDITSSQASVGKTDYRCFYIFNDNPSESMYKCTLFTSPTVDDTTTSILLGLAFRNEVQSLSFTPTETGSVPPEGGTFRLEINSLQTELITYTSDNTLLAANMEEALKNILEDDVTVTYSGTNFTVTFYGVNKNKSFDLLEATYNTITPAYDIEAEKLTIGSPINTIAADIGHEKTVPNGITFTLVGNNGLEIGTLHSNEGFPVWVKRVIPYLSDPLADDGVKVRMHIKSSPNI
jgi:hypothetical protein